MPKLDETQRPTESVKQAGMENLCTDENGPTKPSGSVARKRMK